MLVLRSLVSDILYLVHVLNTINTSSSDFFSIAHFLFNNKVNCIYARWNVFRKFVLEI